MFTDWVSSPVFYSFFFFFLFVLMFWATHSTQWKLHSEISNCNQAAVSFAWHENTKKKVCAFVGFVVVLLANDTVNQNISNLLWWKWRRNFRSVLYIKWKLYETHKFGGSFFCLNVKLKNQNAFFSQSNVCKLFSVILFVRWIFRFEFSFFFFFSVFFFCFFQFFSLFLFFPLEKAKKMKYAIFLGFS